MNTFKAFESALAGLRRYRGWEDVTSVRDATERMELRVTPADRAGATPTVDNCTSARSIRRIYKWPALVFKTILYVKRGTVAERYRLAETLTRESVPHDRIPDGAKYFDDGDYHALPVQPSRKFDAPRASRKPPKKKILRPNGARIPVAIPVGRTHFTRLRRLEGV